MFPVHDNELILYRLLIASVPDICILFYFYQYVYSLLKTVQNTAFTSFEVVMLRCLGFMIGFARFHAIDESLQITKQNKKFRSFKSKENIHKN